MKVQSAAATDVGRIRAHNEDYHLVDPKLGLYVVCDGMGGHAAGDVASKTAAETIRDTLSHAAGPAPDVAELDDAEIARLETVLRNAVVNANEAVFNIGFNDPERRGCGTTCTALFIRAGVGFLAHVGDSRAYLHRQNALHQLSTDHTIVQEAVRNGMSREEAEAVFGSNVLTRAIGPNEQVVVDSLVFHVLPGDSFLLCSDGLHNYFRDEAELTETLGGPLEEMAIDLVQIANDRGGEDNITAVTLRMADAAAPQKDEEVALSRVRQDLAALSHMPLFCELYYSELLEMAALLRKEAYEDGQAIVDEGETSNTLYVISDGSVSVERGGKEVAELGPGSHFGEIAVLTNRPRSATVRSKGGTRLLAFDRPVLVGLFEKRPEIGMKFLWTLAQIQSMRLDEAQVWRAHGDGEAVPGRERPSHADQLFSSPLSARGKISTLPMGTGAVDSLDDTQPSLSKPKPAPHALAATLPAGTSTKSEHGEEDVEP